MPTLGQGIIPGGSYGTELSYITRRAFIPRLIVQIGANCPLSSALLANAQPAMGGISSVTVPVQGSNMTALQWTGVDGSFSQPINTQGIWNAEFNLKGAVIPIPYLGFESLIQQGHDVIPRLDAVMNDAGNVYADSIATTLYNNTTNSQQMIGLPGAVDDGTNLITYGGLNRNTNTWWKSKRYSTSSAPTRALVAQYITGLFKYCGELPNMGVMGPATWQSLQNDFLSVEQFRVTGDVDFLGTSGAHSAFRALSVSGVSIYMDPYCPEGTLMLLNTGYLALHIHEKASFAFTGFESTLSNFQVGYIGAVLSLLELVCVKPKTQAVITGFTYVTI